MNGWPDRVAGSSVGEAGRRSHKLVARTPELLGRAYFLGTFLVRYCAAVAQHSGIAKGDGLVRVECSLVSKPQNAETTCLAHRGEITAAPFIELGSASHCRKRGTAAVCRERRSPSVLPKSYSP